MGLLGGLGKILKLAAPVAGFALGGPLGGMIGGAASSALSGAGKDASAEKRSKQALDMATGRNAELSPLRSKALSMALQQQPERENLDALFADPGNPYARTISRPAPRQMMPGLLGGRQPNTATPVAPPPRQMPQGGGPGGILGRLFAQRGLR